MGLHWWLGEGLGHGVGIVKGLCTAPLREVEVGPTLPAVKGDGAPGTCSGSC